MTLALCLVSLWWMRRIHATHIGAAPKGSRNHRNEVGSSVL